MRFVTMSIMRNPQSHLTTAMPLLWVAGDGLRSIKTTTTKG